MMPGKKAILYALFALIATIVNIAGQEVSTRLYSGHFSIYVSILAGTFIGLVVKYILDKRYIFQFMTKTHSQDGFLFVLYGVMGILTTLIFWGFELAFHVIFETKTMRYLGGIIGLAIGYMSKYFLDKNFVFVER